MHLPVNVNQRELRREHTLRLEHGDYALRAAMRTDEVAVTDVADVRQDRGAHIFAWYTTGSPGEADKTYVVVCCLGLESNVYEPLAVIVHECRLRRCFCPSPRSEKERGRLALAPLPVDELRVELIEGLFSRDDESRLLLWDSRHQCAQQAGKGWFRFRFGDQGSF